jgi:hypothetical protein
MKMCGAKHVSFKRPKSEIREMYALDKFAK